MKSWISKETITSKNLEIIEKEASKIKTPYDVGRMALKISGNFAGFTADQWLNWTLIYSAVTLKGILPQPDYNCWLLFVKACSLLCCKLIKKVTLLLLINIYYNFVETLKHNMVLKYAHPTCIFNFTSRTHC